jgi:hypothetical protein
VSSAFGVADPRQQAVGKKGEGFVGPVSRTPSALAHHCICSDFHILSAKKARIHSSELLAAQVENQSGHFGTTAFQEPVDFLDNQLRQMAIAFLLTELELPIESWVQLPPTIDCSARHAVRATHHPQWHAIQEQFKDATSQLRRGHGGTSRSA